MGSVRRFHARTNIVTSGSGLTCWLQWPCTAGSKGGRLGQPVVGEEVLAGAEHARAAVPQADFHLPPRISKSLRRLGAAGRSRESPPGCVERQPPLGISGDNWCLGLALGEGPRPLHRKRARPSASGEQHDLGGSGGRQDRDGSPTAAGSRARVPHDQFDGRPVIGICNTFSELTPCNSHFRTLAEQVKIGVYEAGGFPLEFPVMSAGRDAAAPTAMLYRNLASMDVEESIRGNPIDGVVLLMGCDKTTPSLLMGAASVDLPTIGVGPAAPCSTASGAARSWARAPASGA